MAGVLHGAPEAARVQVASGDPFGPTVWDSGLISLHGATALRYNGTQLQPGTAYHWQVEVLDSDGISSGMSAPSRFVTGLWDAWTAEAIWAPTPLSTSQFLFMRKEWFVGEAPKSAFAFVTAQPMPSGGFSAKILASYRLLVNGILVGMGPGRPGRCGPTFPPVGGSAVCEREHVYDGFDILPLLQAGVNNTVAIEAFAPATRPSGTSPKVVLQAELVHADGSAGRFGTDDTWSVFGADAYKGPGELKGPEYGQVQENMDARQEPVGWKTSGFAPASGAAWPLAAIVPGNFSGNASLRARMTSPIAVSARVEPARVTYNALNSSWFVDMGREVMGGLTVSIAQFATALPNGLKLRVQLGEELLPDGHVMSRMRTGNNYEETWVLRNSTGGEQTFTHHEYMEWRYAEITLLQPSPPSSPASALDQCVSTALVHNTAAVGKLQCVAVGDVVSDVLFASYGLPSGQCIGAEGNNTFAINPSCHAASSEDIVRKECVGKTGCKVVAGPSTFGIDPCIGKDKRLAVALSCSKSPKPVLDLSVVAWVVKYPFDTSQAYFRSASNDLDEVWNLCKYTIEATTIDM